MKVEDIPNTPMIITARELARQMMESYHNGTIDCLESLIETGNKAPPSHERDVFLSAIQAALDIARVEPADG
jgi:hypothetical protein